MVKKIAKLEELNSTWSLDDVYKANDMLSITNEIQEAYTEKPTDK